VLALEWALRPKAQFGIKRIMQNASVLWEVRADHKCNLTQTDDAIQTNVGRIFRNMAPGVAKDRGVPREYFGDPLCKGNITSVSIIKKAILHTQ
jgi:hypothetical protein